MTITYGYTFIIISIIIVPNESTHFFFIHYNFLYTYNTTILIKLKKLFHLKLLIYFVYSIDYSIIYYDGYKIYHYFKIK